MTSEPATANDSMSTLKPEHHVARQEEADEEGGGNEGRLEGIDRTPLLLQVDEDGRRPEHVDNGKEHNEGAGNLKGVETGKDIGKFHYFIVFGGWIWEFEKFRSLEVYQVAGESPLRRTSPVTL